MNTLIVFKYDGGGKHIILNQKTFSSYAEGIGEAMTTADQLVIDGYTRFGGVGRINHLSNFIDLFKDGGVVFCEAESDMIKTILKP